MGNTLLKADKIVKNFAIDGSLKSIVNYGEGHINETYLLTVDNLGQEVNYILQKINNSLFKDVDALMQNIKGVTEFARQEIIKQGGDPERETLTVIPAVDGKAYYFDGEDYYRVYVFIKVAIAYQITPSTEVFNSSAQAFGNFARLLERYPAETLTETIPNFHNTRNRFNNFKNSLKANLSGRADFVKDEIDFVLSREDYCGRIVDKIASGEIPLKVTHNDTKLNNVLFDKTSNKAIAVIDLDTVMPGSILYDFGDSVRFGCNPAAEDEKDLSKVVFSMELFEAYVKGYLSSLKGSITGAELDNLAFSAILMTFECGMRFLTDHIDGDTYFKIKRENHNLDRCRTQFKLVSDMEKRLDEMNAIVKKYS